MPGLPTDEFPVFRVDERGTIAPAGTLITLASHESVWLPSEHVLDGLPVGRSATPVEQSVPAVNTLHVWDQARALAATFWRRAANEDLSQPMRRLVKAHAQR